MAAVWVVALPATAAPPPVFWPDDVQPLLDGKNDGEHQLLLSDAEIRARLDAGHLPDDPRSLGRALVLLRDTPPAHRDARSWWLQGRIEQRLHLFEHATASLNRAAEMAPQSPTYALEQFYVALALGAAPAASKHCDRIGALQEELLFASCAAQLQLKFGSLARAQAVIEMGLSQAGPTSGAHAQLEARITLADILSARGDQAAVGAWLAVLGKAPDSAYARDQLARQLLSQQRNTDVERITRGQQAPGLLVSRMIALRQLKDPRADALEERLERIFRLARWRGDGLHRNEHVRFLARVKGDKPAALALAHKGWSRDPTPENRRVLLNLAMEMGESSLASDLSEDISLESDGSARTNL